VTVAVQSSPHNVGDVYAYVITLVNNGGTSNFTNLTVNLPTQTSYNGSVVDRGPGCTNSGTTVTCSLDFFPSDLPSTVIVGAKVNSLGTLVMTTSVTSGPSEANTTDGSVTTTLNLGSSASAPVTAPFAPPSSTPKQKTVSAPSFATFVLEALKPILLHLHKHTFKVTVKTSKATGLTLTLHDKKGNKLGSWHEHAKAGTNTFTLLLPAGARKPGHDTLQITATGNPTSKTLGVTLLA
jgi:hypothetical protein